MRDCSVCQQPVRPEERLTNGNLQWHSYCFRCSHCYHNADPRTARVINERIFCPEHVVYPIENPLNHHLDDYVEQLTRHYEKGNNLAESLLSRHESYQADRASNQIKNIVSHFQINPSQRLQRATELDPFQIDFLRKQGFQVEFNSIENTWLVSY